MDLLEAGAEFPRPPYAVICFFYFLLGEEPLDGQRLSDAAA